MLQTSARHLGTHDGRQFFALDGETWMIDKRGQVFRDAAAAWQRAQAADAPPPTSRQPEPAPFRLVNDPPPHQPARIEPAERARQRPLFAGLHCLAGQRDLFATDGEG